MIVVSGPPVLQPRTAATNKASAVNVEDVGLGVMTVLYERLSEFPYNN